MTPRNQILLGDARTLALQLDDNSIHCIVTSPPYFGLRDYKVDGQMGLEKTPEEFIQEMVKLFHLLKQKLRDDGTLWLNIGDSYAGSWGNYSGNSRGFGEQRERNGESFSYNGYEGHNGRPAASMITGKNSAYKPKDLIGVPWQLAFALRADGWHLRQDIIWHKMNPMPESVRDRCTKSHEYLFLLTKSPRYYYDYVAIMTDAIDAKDDQRRMNQQHKGNKSNATSEVNGLRPKKIKMPDGWDSSTGQGSHGSFHKNGREKGATRTSGNIERKPRPGTPDDNTANQNGSVPWEGGKANKRSVWSVATEAFNEAHFATFPQKLIVDCIKAGSSEFGCCSECGAPWSRVVDRELVDTYKVSHGSEVDARDVDADDNDQGANRMKDGHTPGMAVKITNKGWMPTCECNASITPCVVLDPFMGAGTTAIVARKLGRDYLGFELNAEYRKMAMRRIDRELGMFA